jgi:AcrR family transcriptional regulator
VDLMAGDAPKERADAARNRRKVLAAAGELFAARGVAAVSMDDVAAAAGVGKGTLYRRFGDKSGLAAALLDERESQLQRELLSGPPPLGPGAPPVDRLAAFAAAYLAYVDAHLDVVALSQTASPGARLRTGSHRFWRLHCRILLAEAGAPDPDLRADALLAALTAEQVRHWRHDEGRLPADLTRAVSALARSLAEPAVGTSEP